MAKRIGAIVSLTIIGILIVATLVMANVKINYSIVCSQPETISVYNGNGTYREAKTEQKDKIVELINGASKMSALDALFSKKLGKKAMVDSKSGTINYSSGYLVRYSYNSNQTLKQGKKTFKDADGNSYEYKELVFEIKEKSGETEFYVYVIPDISKQNEYSHVYKLDANFEELFSYLKSNFNV